MSVALSFRQWVKAGDTPLAQLIYKVGWGVRRASMPSIPAIHKPLYMVHCAVRDGLNTAVMALWFKPLFLSQMPKPAKSCTCLVKACLIWLVPSNSAWVIAVAFQHSALCLPALMEINSQN